MSVNTKTFGALFSTICAIIVGKHMPIKPLYSYNNGWSILQNGNEWMFYGLLTTDPKVRMNNTDYYFLLFKIIKINGNFVDFRQLVQKLERITPIISTLQDEQNEWSFDVFSSVRTNNTNYFCSSRPAKYIVILWVFDDRFKSKNKKH